ncbi:MAG: hypothetical protein NC039_04750 [Muribaculaceae bacterium]|nr:hypothetical protein [Muribaculaceae bacterium]
MVLTAIIPLSLKAQGIADIARVLSEAGCYEAEARLSVTLPQTDTDVTYSLKFNSMATPSDSLSPATYAVEWSLPTPSGVAEGFTAYFDGNLYRFRDSRLQEYHMDWDAMPFRRSAPGGGVQRSAQFVNLLPQFMGEEIMENLSDSAYSFTLNTERTFDGSPATEIREVMTIGGETVRERTYILDRATSLPIRVVTESSPGAISEQTIIVDYTTAPTPQCSPLSEEVLMERYPEVFEKYRVSNFRIENLRDTPLPAFALPTLTGERHIHHRGDPFRQSTVIAIIDPTSGSFNADMVKALRTAADNASAPSDLILAFATTNADMAEQTAGTPRSGETMLLNARSLARDCGATDLPVVIVTDATGTVRNVVLGYNNNLSEIVLQSLELL